jgi:hypothetical protein
MCGSMRGDPGLRLPSYRQEGCDGRHTPLVTFGTKHFLLPYRLTMLSSSLTDWPVE